MKSAQEAISAALRTAATVLLAGVLLAGLAFSSPTKKAKPKARPASASVVGSRRSHKTAETSQGTARSRTRKVVVTRRKVNGKWVRVSQVARAPQGPAYQTHPDTERYQQIQQALASGGYYKGEVNGKWDDDSVAALKHFQTDRQLPNDGRISSLSLIGLGLGPNRQTAPAPAPVSPSSN